MYKDIRKESNVQCVHRDTEPIVTRYRCPFRGHWVVDILWLCPDCEEYVFNSIIAPPKIGGAE